MKISQVRCIPLYGRPLHDSWQERMATGREQIHVLVELRTDEGVTGLGSAFTSHALVAAALDLLNPILIGASALDPAAVAEDLHQRTFWQGRGGSVTHAISAVDIALWDLFGKITGQPVSRLLGGRHRDRIKPYASMLMGEPDVMKERVATGLERGFRAFKLGWGPFGRRDDFRFDESIVAAAREEGGDDIEIMVDAGGSEEYWPHGYKWALRTSRMLATYDVRWFEEPLRPDDLDGYIRLTEHAPLPISGGEVLTRRQSFKEWLDRRAVDYIQPDVTKVGGISEQHHIGRMAHENGILMVPHGWNTGVGLAADLQLVAAAINARWVEYMSPNEYIDTIVAEPFKLDNDGYLDIPNGPGLGIKWDPEGIAALSGGETISESTI